MAAVDNQATQGYSAPDVYNHLSVTCLGLLALLLHLFDIASTLACYTMGHYRTNFSHSFLKKRGTLRFEWTATYFI